MQEQYGKLTLLTFESAARIGNRVDSILSEWRNGEHFQVPVECPRFSSGEAKCIIHESVRDRDVYILLDVCNHALKYKMYGEWNRMSPDDHYQDLKRAISACNGRAARISVVMPFLYESRQHRKTTRESLDCAMMLRELESLGVHTLLTFDAHDPRVQNVVPLMGLENISPALQFTQALLTEYEDLTLDGDHMMFISPDEGATARTVLMASVFGINMGLFYKRRDYTRIIDGCNPIISHDFSGASVAEKDVIVIDDMIVSGGSMIDTARQLKERGAKRVFIFATFGLFAEGMEKFDSAYERRWFDRILTTNLTYQRPELMGREYHLSVRMERYIAALIDRLNQGLSIQDMIKPEKRMHQMIEQYKHR